MHPWAAWSSDKYCRGYDYVEQHTVPTQDRYLLCLFRIPHGKREGGSKMKLGKRRSRSRSRSSSVVASTAVVDNVDQFATSSEPTTNGIPSMSSRFSHKESTVRKRGWNGKPVVLLNHGFLMSSEIWLCNLKESQNLPFLLAEQGCDVWFANARGNKYSQQHMSKNPKDLPFWDFSLNEMAMYDLPDAVDVSIFRRFACEIYSLFLNHCLLVYIGDDRSSKFDLYWFQSRNCSSICRPIYQSKAE